MILYLLLLSLLQEPIYIPKSRVLEIHKEYVVFETIDRKQYRLYKQFGNSICVADNTAQGEGTWWIGHGKRLQVGLNYGAGICFGGRWVDVP